MADNAFPANERDMTAKKILDKYFKVTPRDNYPKFIPYVDRTGESVSPLTDFMYYHKLPEVYRTFDETLGRPLYRYLQSLIEGGYANVVNNSLKGKRGIENLLDLIDPQTCPDEFLPLYCKSMGIDWFPDLITEERGTYYLRTFLCNIGEIYKRRGTESVVKYIAKVLTEMDVIVRYERVIDAGKTVARIMWVELQANTQEEINKTGLSSKVIKRYVDTQIPYYITSAILYVIRFDTHANRYNGNFVRSTIRKTIQCDPFELTFASDYEYLTTDDYVVILKYIGKTKNPIIPSEIENLPVKKISGGAFSETEVERVRIPQGVEEIE